MFAFTQGTVSSIISFIILAAASLVSVGIAGSLSAYIKLWIGDQAAIEEGFGDPNPFVHIDVINIIIFLIFKILWRVRQPFSWYWSEGARGYVERVVYVIGVGCVHLLLASGALLTGTMLWGISFYKMAFIYPGVSAHKQVSLVKALFAESSSLSRIAILLCAAFIMVNLILCLFELLNRVIEYVLMTYIFPYRQDLWIHILSVLLIFSLFLVFESPLWAAAWRIAAWPVRCIL